MSLSAPLRRPTESMTVGGQSADMKLAMTISDYGTAVNVTAPPSDQVFDMTQLAAQAAQSAQGQSSSGVYGG